MYCRLTNLYCCFLGVITAADNIKYPAINAFVRAFKQDQGGPCPQQGSLDDTALRNNHTGKLPKLESKPQGIFIFLVFLYQSQLVKFLSCRLTEKMR